MNITAYRRTSLALADLIEGTCNWRIWYVLGISELRQRYRRSVLGPFWVTLTMAVQAAVMGFLLSFLFKLEIARYLPFLCISLVTWNFVNNAVNEGANCFISQGGVILQVKRPLWTYIMLTLWRNAIVYAHTVIVFFVAAVFFGLLPSRTYLLIPIGLAILLVNVGWMALCAGLLAARFRDVPVVVQNAFNVLLWLTPVFYHPSQLSQSVRIINDVNPLTYVFEVARAPFLNEVPPLWVWIAAVGLAIIGWTVTFALFVRARARVPYWL